MKTVLIIGIGAGDPEYLTVQAVNALNRADVFFLLDKGADKETLVDFRRKICRRYIRDRDFRFVDAASPEWDRRSDAYLRYADQDIDIYCGAYIGTPDEILIAGKLKDVAEEIARTRAEAGETHGWIMDTYLMRRNNPPED